MKPISVLVRGSEAPSLEKKDTYTFHEFERLARQVALEHTTGGYLKTHVRVTYDNGETFDCRIDLSPKVTGYRDYVRRTYRTLLPFGGGMSDAEKDVFRLMEDTCFEEGHVLTQPNVPVRVHVAHGYVVEVQDHGGEEVSARFIDPDGKRLDIVKASYINQEPEQ